MSRTYGKLSELKSKSYNGYWEKRILSELEFLYQVSAFDKSVALRDIDAETENLYAIWKTQGAISKQTALDIEAALVKYSKNCKAFSVICAGHAHIDMNWMWGLQETAAVTADTFRTVLGLMDEYPEFTFSQSQASTYRIIEEYAPDMLPEIKRRIKEGRWEVTASTWVETDHNMTSGESLTRHLLYTKDYLSKLLDIDPASLEIDFSPDTFGHTVNLPEILSTGGIKYMYYCRGYDGHSLFRWQAPSGKSVIAYCEIDWYNADMEYGMFTAVPRFCSENGINTMLKVYGVGDHGGGPTRRDIEIVLDMKSWPFMPSIRFGTFREFFKTLDAVAARLPVVSHELNYIFTGCYTTQSRIKAANRISEERLYDAEALTTLSSVVAGGRDYAKSYVKAWENVLFNHFHDILPGSGVTETREYALGNFQKTMAYAITNARAAINKIAGEIDTSGIITEDDRLTRSEGAGVGIGAAAENEWETLASNFPHAERGRGKVRIFTLFNTLGYPRRGVVELVVWDYTGNLKQIGVKNSAGQDVEFQILNPKGQSYWGHRYVKIAIMAEIEAFGYSTYVLSENEDMALIFPRNRDVREDNITDADIVLENNLMRAVFDTRTMRLTSLVDKKTGFEAISAPACSLRYICEDDVKGMTSWRVGKYTKVVDLNAECETRVYDISNGGGLEKWIKYSFGYKNSQFDVTVSLSENSPLLKFSFHIDWQERGQKRAGVPQLGFYVPFTYSCDTYRYNVAMGTIDRPAIRQDVPSIGWALGVGLGERSLLLVSDSKYGFRGCDSSLSVTLLRSAFDPDPHPELGMHDFSLGVALCAADNGEIFRISDELSHPLYFVSNLSHTGKLPLTGGFTSTPHGVKISAVKSAEDSSGAVILRGYDITGTAQNVSFRFACPLRAANFVNACENPTDGAINISGNTVCFNLGANAVFALKLVF